GEKGHWTLVEARTTGELRARGIVAEAVSAGKGRLPIPPKTSFRSRTFSIPTGVYTNYESGVHRFWWPDRINQHAIEHETQWRRMMGPKKSPIASCWCRIGHAPCLRDRSCCSVDTASVLVGHFQAYPHTRHRVPEYAGGHRPRSCRP